MPINVQFDKAGFYHPAFGRMGRSKNAGRVYSLPDFFAAPGKLPASAKILADKEQLEAVLEKAEQTKPIKPKVVDEAQLQRAEQAADGVSATNRRPPVQSRRKPSAEE